MFLCSWEIGLGLFSCIIFIWFCYQGKLLASKAVGKYIFLLCSLVEFLYSWCYFLLKCLVEFTSVTIWSRRVFLMGKLLTINSVSLILYRTTHFIYFLVRFFFFAFCFLGFVLVLVALVICMSQNICPFHLSCQIYVHKMVSPFF